MKLKCACCRSLCTMPVMVALFAALGLNQRAIAQEPEDGYTVIDPWGSSELNRLQATPEQIAQALAGIPPAINNTANTSQLNSYIARAQSLDDAAIPVLDPAQVTAMLEFSGWWEPGVRSPLGLAAESISVDVGGLTQTALVLSPFVRSVLTEPKILQNDLVVENAAFDSLAFIEGKFAGTNDPVGSALTTGDNSNRFLDDTFTSAAGIRKRSQSGGALEVAQRGGFQSNNSTFLIPNPQGTTRLEINFTQPLMRDRGRAVNQTRIVLAQIDVQLANAEARQDLQEHLINVTRSYWTLYQSRAEWLLRYRLYERAIELRDVLQARGMIDSQQRQVLRAESAVASRQSDLFRAETRIRNAQARLRMLTGDPRLKESLQWELIPQELPLAYPITLSQRNATITALDNRPDIAEAIKKIQATTTRVGAAKNQVLPRLDLILHSHLAGLDAERNTFGALGNQFADGGPSYAAGLLYESPIGNRAAQARLARNRWELTRAMYEFQQTTEEAFTEVEIALREGQTAYADMVSKKLSIEAANREVNYLHQRWTLLPNPADSAVLLIEDLLDAQERLADEETEFVSAQVSYAMSWVQLRQSMGVLLRMNDDAVVACIANDSCESDESR